MGASDYATKEIRARRYLVPTKTGCGSSGRFCFAVANPTQVTTAIGAAYSAASSAASSGRRLSQSVCVERLRQSSITIHNHDNITSVCRSSLSDKSYVVAIPNGMEAIQAHGTGSRFIFMSMFPDGYRRQIFHPSSSKVRKFVVEAHVRYRS